MTFKSHIALAAIAAALFGTMPTAQANHMSFGIGFGFPIVSPPPPGPGLVPGHVNIGFQFGMGGHGHHHGHWGHHHNHGNYGVSCRTGRNIVRSSGFSHVKSIDCTAPSYGYLGWKNGRLYQVRVNVNGTITGASVVY